MNNNPVDTAPLADVLNQDFLVGNVAEPFVIGLAVGFFAKKMLKTALFVLGAGVVLLFISQHFGFKGLNNLNLQEVGGHFMESVKQAFGFLKERLSNIQGGSGVGGFIVGFKLG
ncbi:MAG: hypothetical protein NT008_04650 [Methylococcales bacterium]|jgi:uncharacterized membrane protein (Fun14 family)|nr:hypothetical protein [Methylococcales bacterium]